MGNQQIRDIISEEQARIKKEIEVSGPLPEITEDLLSHAAESAQASRESILDNKLTLEQLVKIYHKKKLIEKNENKGMTEVFFDRPLELSKALDAKTLEEKKKLPLYGFVMSLKECIYMQGTLNTCGMMLNRGIRHKYPSPFVDFLESQGAVIVCKGNVPQLVFAMETDNNLYGASCNPVNKDRVPGGSSGGEGTILGLGLANGSIGSDVAGSVRIPALLSGIYGLKPTTGRWETGMHSTFSEYLSDSSTLPNYQDIIKFSMGPLARSAVDIEVLAKAMNDYTALQPTYPPLPWRTPNRSKKIGFFHPVGLVELPNCSTRALSTVRAALEAAGYEVIDLEIPSPELIMSTTMSAFFKDDLQMYYFDTKVLKEPLIPCYKGMGKLANLSVFMAKQLREVYTGRVKLNFDYYINAKTKNSNFFRELQHELTLSMIKLYKDAGIEVAIAPGLPPAPLHGKSENISFYCFYTFMWNLLGFPAGAVPVTKVREYEQEFESHFKDDIATDMQKLMQNSLGLPVGVQVAGLPWKDEEVVDIMKELEVLLLKRKERGSAYDISSGKKEAKETPVVANLEEPVKSQRKESKEQNAVEEKNATQPELEEQDQKEGEEPEQLKVEEEPEQKREDEAEQKKEDEPEQLKVEEEPEQKKEEEPEKNIVEAEQKQEEEAIKKLEQKED